jgi:uncharacterized protein (DUF2236 family)
VKSMNATTTEMTTMYDVQVRETADDAWEQECRCETHHEAVREALANLRSKRHPVVAARVMTRSLGAAGYLTVGVDEVRADGDMRSADGDMRNR